MVIQQTWNSRVKRWVKFKIVKKGNKRFPQWLDQKQKNPKVPFKGVPIAATSSRQK